MMPSPGHPTMAFHFRDFAHDYVESLVETLSEMPLAPIEEFWKLVEAAREKNSTVHFIVTVVVLAPSPVRSWSKERLKTISHVDNAASLTAWANDTHYDNVFVGQLKTFAARGDLVVGFSGSGNSKNVLNGLELAKEIGCKTVAVTGDYMGKGGGKVVDIADVCIIVQSDSMERIEDLQLVINHILKEAVKANNGL